MAYIGSVSKKRLLIRPYGRHTSLASYICFLIDESMRIDIILRSSGKILIVQVRVGASVITIRLTQLVRVKLRHELPLVLVYSIVKRYDSAHAQK